MILKIIKQTEALLFLCVRVRALHRLCLSITDFHPDTWNPAWSVSTILTGLLSFMVEKGPTLGSIETSDYTVSAKPFSVELLLVTSEISDVHVFSVFQKRQLSAQSLAFNLKDKVFCELFPDVVDVCFSAHWD